MSSFEKLTAADAVDRLVARDATLWSDDSAVQSAIAERLGWTSLASESEPIEGRAIELARAFRAMGITDFVLLGMGGSSLAALTMSEIFSATTTARLHVLDTTAPATVARLMRDLDPKTTVFFVSSKSGGTIEPNSLYSIFRRWAEPALGADVGERFVAITDTGTSLERLAAESGFRTTVLTPDEVGGRYSALTAFGLVPAAAIGVDVGAMLGAARVAEARCSMPGTDNPAAQLATFVGDAFADGRDKLTLVTTPSLRSFGLWVEQLIAESTGKAGTGVVPVVDLAPSAPAGLGSDRAVVVVRTAEDTDLAAWAGMERARLPLFEIVLDTPASLGAEFVRWEFATALIGFLLGIEPFDQPNVAEAKAATLEVLEGRAQAPAPNGLDGDIAISCANLTCPAPTLASALAAALDALGDRGYLGLLVYLPNEDGFLAPLRDIVPALTATTGRAVTFELGPRYLHSTGQLHKGGPDEGVFVIVTARDDVEIAVPGKPWRLGDLYRSQAIGDFLTLARSGRPVVHLDLPKADEAQVDRVALALVDDALGI